jgi:hypothetical protein
MVLNEAALVLLARRMFGGAVSWASWSVGLGRAGLGSLTPRSSLEEFQELSAADNPGYARAAATLTVNTDSDDGPEARFTLPAIAFQNSGTDAWQTAKNLFIVGNSGGELWIFAQSISDLSLAAGDSFTPYAFEPGDHTIVIQGRSTNRSEPATPG